VTLELAEDPEGGVVLLPPWVVVQATTLAAIGIRMKE
jgi:hypothetical protein